MSVEHINLTAHFNSTKVLMPHALSVISKNVKTMNPENLQTNSWCPSPNGRVILDTLEATDCADPRLSCRSSELKTLLHECKQIEATYDCFATPEDLLNKLGAIADKQLNRAAQLGPDDSVVIQLSAHGTNFKQIDFNNVSMEVSQIAELLENKLTQRTILLLNLCWGAWPIWSRIFRSGYSSPRLVFGSRKRFGTSIEALNAAELRVIKWLIGQEYVGVHAECMPAIISTELEKSYVNHANFYRVFFWNGNRINIIPEQNTSGPGFPNIKRHQMMVDDIIVYVALEEGSEEEGLFKARYPGKPLVGKYSYRKDPAISGTNQKHIHVFCRKKELFALNWDGSAHDNSHRTKIESKVVRALQDLFPDLTIPEDNYIKCHFD